MDIYIKNYWSLYLDFLDDFKNLTYKGFSLPYLCHFRSLEKNIDHLLYDKDLNKQLNHSIRERREVQEKFNRFIHSHKNNKSVKNQNGMVVFHDVYNLLRFSKNNVSDYCNPSKSMMICEDPKSSKTRNKNKQQTENRKTFNKRKKNIVSLGSVIRIKGKIKQPIKNSKAVNRMRFEYFSSYSTDIEKEVTEIQHQARTIFNKHKSHPLYSDKKFQSSLLMQVSKIINRIEESENFLSNVNVSCVVLASTHYYQSRTLALVAAKKGIPTICMQHGIIGKEIGYIPRIATVDAVYGHFEVDWYKRLGEHENSLEIIGHPRFDQAFKRSSVSRAEFNNKVGLDSSKKTLVIVVRGKREFNRWQMLIEQISNKADLNIAIKDFHTHKTHALSLKYPFVHTIKDYKLYDIFPNVDAIVAYPSTVGLEAMIANKTVFILNNGFSGDSGYFNSLDELVQKDPRKLARLIIKYFTNSDWKNYADKKRDKFLSYAYPDMSLSGERLKNLIKKLTT